MYTQQIFNDYSRRAFLRNSLMTAAGLALSKYTLAQNPTDLTYLSIAEVSELVRQKKVSPVELTKACLKRIERLNPKVNAFITITADRALSEAKEAENEIKNGQWKGPLHGIPIALKDNIDTVGIRTTGASALFKDRIPSEDAEIVRRLKAAGAVILGKLNMHECAAGSTSATSYFGPVHNPWNLDLIAGGSSGGSAAAIAANMCYGAIGTDTGGSIRIPAACCGIVGLKPTYGLVSKQGVIPNSESLDHVGPMCRTVTDTAILLSVIAGADPKDKNSISSQPVNYATQLYQSVTSFRLGKLLSRFENLDREIKIVIDAAMIVLTKLTAGFQEVNLPATPDFFSSVASVETYAFYEPYLGQAQQLFQPATLKALRMVESMAEKITATQYINGLHSLHQIRNSSMDVFKAVDFLVTPTIPRLPLRILECTDPFQMPGAVGRYNFYGWPTITIPCGFTSSGLPAGIEIAGPAFSESKLLALAYAYEQATGWYKKHPVLE